MIGHHFSISALCKAPFRTMLKCEPRSSFASNGFRSRVGSDYQSSVQGQPQLPTMPVPKFSVTTEATPPIIGAARSSASSETSKMRRSSSSVARMSSVCVSMMVPHFNVPPTHAKNLIRRVRDCRANPARGAIHTKRAFVEQALATSQYSPQSFAPRRPKQSSSLRLNRLLRFLLRMTHAGRSALFQKLLMSHSAADTGSRIKIEAMSPHCSIKKCCRTATIGRNSMWICRYQDDPSKVSK